MVLRTKTKFQLGRILVMPGCRQFELKDIFACIARHHLGDWGECCDEDKQSNDDALENGGRLLSSYKINNEKVWVITEAETTEGKGDRASTTVLLPEEY